MASLPAAGGKCNNNDTLLLNACIEFHHERDGHCKNNEIRDHVANSHNQRQLTVIDAVAVECGVIGLGNGDALGDSTQEGRQRPGGNEDGHDPEVQAKSLRGEDRAIERQDTAL